MRKGIISLVVVGLLIILTGCGRVVPPGVTVVILDANGNAKTYQKGVYFAWGRDKVYFIDTKLASFEEKMHILCKDNINMDVSVKWIGCFEVTSDTIETIKSKIPAKKVNRGDISGYNLSLETFYDMAVKDIIAAISRQVISQYRTDNINEQREIIRQTIKDRVLKRLKELKYPLHTTDVLITNLDYPEEVTMMRKRIKNAELKDQENAAIAKAAVAKARRDAELAAEKGKAQLVKAKADAEANRIRAKSLTPEIIMTKQIEMYEKLIESGKGNIIVIPYNAIGKDLTNTLLLKRTLEQK